MEISYLRGYWQRALGVAGAPPGAVDLDTTLLSGLRLGLRETLLFLNATRPSYDEFAAWIVERNGGAMDEPSLTRLRRAMSPNRSFLK